MGCGTYAGAIQPLERHCVERRGYASRNSSQAGGKQKSLLGHDGRQDAQQEIGNP